LLEDLDFADDVAFLSSTKDQLQQKTIDQNNAANGYTTTHAIGKRGLKKK